MTSRMAAITKSKGFYGWIALSGAMLSLISEGISGNSFGVFLPVITEEFGWSRAAVAAAYSICALAAGLLSPLWGIMAARFGPRINIIMGSILSAVGLASLYFLHDLWYLYLLFIFIGLGTGLGGNIQSTTLANNWFTKKVSLTQGIIGAASGIAGFIFPPLAVALIAAVEWRLSWVILGGIIFIGATVIGGIGLVRNRPEDLGQVPDGIKAKLGEADANIRPISEKIESQAEWTLKKLLKMPATWLIFAFVIANRFIMGTMMTQQVAYIQDLGFSPMTGATTMSILAAANILGSLTFGALALRLNIRYLGISAFMLHLIGLVILLTNRELGWLYAYSVLVGMGYGAILAAIPTFISTYYGRKIYSRIIGFAMAFHAISGAVAAVFAGMIYDATGSYKVAFMIVLIFVLIGMASIFSARKPKVDKLILKLRSEKTLGNN